MSKRELDKTLASLEKARRINKTMKAIENKVQEAKINYVTTAWSEKSQITPLEKISPLPQTKNQLEKFEKADAWLVISVVGLMAGSYCAGAFFTMLGLS